MLSAMAYIASPVLVDEMRSPGSKARFMFQPWELTPDTARSGRVWVGAIATSFTERGS